MSDNPSLAQREPVVISAAGLALLQALIVLALVFEWVDWDVDQIAAVQGVYAAVIVVVGLLARRKVTPVAVLDALTTATSPTTPYTPPVWAAEDSGGGVDPDDPEVDPGDPLF
jgi:hypothetical protein